MREIKFRAWDISRSKIYKFEMEDLLCCEAYDVDEFGYDHIMQYTGLKDKSLKKQNEVHESDIIEFVNGNKAVVEWDNYTSGWIARSIHRPMMKWNLADSLIESALVVGNIYENPELLKEQNDN